MSVKRFQWGYDGMEESHGAPLLSDGSIGEYVLASDYEASEAARLEAEEFSSKTVGWVDDLRHRLAEAERERDELRAAWKELSRHSRLRDDGAFVIGGVVYDDELCHRAIQQAKGEE